LYRGKDNYYILLRKNWALTAPLIHSVLRAECRISFLFHIEIGESFLGLNKNGKGNLLA